MSDVVVVRNFDSKLEQVIKSQEFISCQYDDLRRLTDNLMKTNQELQAENERLKETCRLTKKSANEAVAAVNELEQYGRREMIEIAGIPRLEDENVEQTVIKLCSHLNSTIEDTDIEAAYRISSRESASIIVKFKSRKMRNHVYKMRNMLRNMTTHSIGIAEELLREFSSTKVYPKGIRNFLRRPRSSGNHAITNSSGPKMGISC